MGTQYMLSEVPKDTAVYVFGSILNSISPNDLDLLVIYNPNTYPKTEIYNCCEELISSLSKYFKLDVDVTYLTYSEVKQVSFIEKVEAIPLVSFLQANDESESCTSHNS